MSRALALTLAAALSAGSLTALPSVARAQAFTYDPAGTLVPSRSGRGRVDAKVYAPTMRFPMEQARAFANSQVYGNGGGQGPGGGQCDAVNYAYPWHDNYCESRSYSMPLCPAGTGHQGQDIRPATCVKDTHWAVAAEAGTITSVGSYSVYLTAADGTRFDYLHMSQVQVAVGARVTKGQRLGKVSNVFGGTPTTIHLHFNIRQSVPNVGAVYVPPYTSLVESYKRANGLAPTPDAGATDARVADARTTDARATDARASDGAILPEEPEDPGVPVGPEEPDELPTPQGELAAEQGSGLEPIVEEGCNGSGSAPSYGLVGLGAFVSLAVLRRRKVRA